MFCTALGSRADGTLSCIAGSNTALEYACCAAAVQSQRPSPDRSPCPHDRKVACNSKCS